MLNEMKEKALCRYKDYRITDELENHNYIYAAQRAKKWIERYTIKECGIVITSRQRTIYQEVTGYYIPTLLQWGMRKKAIQYTQWLCQNQQPSGAWLSSDLKCESVFNTGQVMRGLTAIYDILPEVEPNLVRACDWLLSNMQEDGRLASAEGTLWPNNGINSELIHLYCLPPLIEAAQKLNCAYYRECAVKILNYYKTYYIEDINHFNYLSHFYAYVLEALVDLGEVKLASAAMKKVEKLQRMDGAVPAYQSCKWVCSTGLFQFAIIWFKLGQWEQGNKAFDYAVSLQNASGGWFGGYPASVRLGSRKIVPYKQMEQINYFPNEEISWAVKYFFDALHERAQLEFQQKAHTFIKRIDRSDGKYQVVQAEIQRQNNRLESLDVLDVGCGKGRYLKKLQNDLPGNRYYGIDLSEKVLSYIGQSGIILKKSSILKIDYESEKFDVVYAAESLEHAVFLKEAVEEMCRVLKPEGSLVIVDKDEESFEQKKYSSWFDPAELRTKQWLNVERMIQILKEAGLIYIDSFFIPTGEGNMYRAFLGRKRG